MTGQLEFESLRQEYLLDGDPVHRSVYLGVAAWRWREWCGPIPQGFDVHHKYETRACVNPDHLELVSGERDHKQKHGFTLTERVLQMVEARSGPVRACDLAYWADASSDTVSTILHRGVQYGRLERVARGFFVAVRDREGS